MKLPPFKKKTKCPKCGGSNVFAQYRAKHDRGSYGTSSWWIEEDRMERTCEDCTYDWCEAPLDAFDQATANRGGEES